MTFNLITSIVINLDGSMSRSRVQSPAILGEHLRVSVPVSMDQAAAARLLRRCADELEAGR